MLDRETPERDGEPPEDDGVEQELGSLRDKVGAVEETEKIITLVELTLSMARLRGQGEGLEPEIDGRGMGMKGMVYLAAGAAPLRLPGRDPDRTFLSGPKMM